MPFKKFNEYLDEKNKVVSKPKNKDMKNSKIKKDSNALGHEGDSKLVYEPKTTPVELKNAPDWHKSKTREWLDSTKKMSISEFAKNIYEKNPVKTNSIVTKMVEELSNNPKAFESLVRNVKRANLLENLVQELIKIKEVKNILESVSKPIGFENMDDMEDDDMEDDDMEDDDMEDDDMEDDDMEDDDMEDDDMEDDDMEDDDMDMGDEEGMEGMNSNNDMENDMPLGRRKNNHERDYFSDEM